MGEPTYNALNDTERLQRVRKLSSGVLDPFSIKDVRKEIVELIIDHIEENGSCRAGWAADYLIGTKQQNHVHDKIAGLVTKTGKYVKERNEHFPKDWTLYYNPNYEFAQISKRTSIVQRWALIITVGVSILTLVV